jgi:hypothetical protein
MVTYIIHCVPDQFLMEKVFEFRGCVLVRFALFLCEI